MLLMAFVTNSGWYLSMDPKGSFLHHEAVEEERNTWFEGYSQKTIGAVVVRNVNTALKSRAIYFTSPESQRWHFYCKLIV